MITFLTIFFCILGAVSLVLSIIFNKKNDKQSSNLITKTENSLSKLNKTTEDVEAIASQLNKTTQDVEAIAKHLSFGSIKPFPYGLEDVIELLRAYKKKAIDDNREFCLDIYTDVPGYAVFGHNQLWNKFYDCLKDICSEAENGFPIHWYFYTDTRLEKQISEQFDSWKYYDLKQLKKEIYLRSGYDEHENRLKFQHGRNCKYNKSGFCQSGNETECKRIIELKKEVDLLQSKEEVPQFVDEKVFSTMKHLHNKAIERINDLSDIGTVRYKDKRVDENLPFFAWIILEKIPIDTKGSEKKYELTPTEGIVSYNYYDEKKEAIEKGFRTSDRKLIRSLYDIVHSFSRQQLEKSNQQNEG